MGGHIVRGAVRVLGAWEGSGVVVWCGKTSLITK